MVIRMNESGITAVRLYLEPAVDMYYGTGTGESFCKKIQSYEYDRIYFVTEKNAYELHGRSLYERLQKNCGTAELVFISSSEKDKNMEQLDRLCSHLIERRISKDSLIISFGGGMACNITGLAAALIYRGVRYVEVPTTFLALTDSSVSHKQAVNGRSGKNQLGTYYAPLFVWADLQYAATESSRHFYGGVVEGIKNALISDKSLLQPLCELLEKPRTDKRTEELFRLIVCSKNKILKKDPTEKGASVILEYGHTFGHAVEFLTGGNVIHGEAVAMGMCMAAELGYILGTLEEKELALHYELLTPYMYAPERFLEWKTGPDEILTAIQKDNKRTKDGVKYVLLDGIGQCMNPDGSYQVKTEEALVKRAVERFLEKFYIEKGGTE